MSRPAPRRTRLGGLFRRTWRATSLARRPISRAIVPVAAPIARPLAALAAPMMRTPLAIAGASLGRAVAELDRPVFAFRHGDEDVPPGDLADLLVRTTTLTGRLLVLVPPPGEDEYLWAEGRDTTGATYAERLQTLLGWTPIHTRLDVGSPSRAGIELASQLQRLTGSWPVPVERIVLLAAGNGGLAVRAATAMRLPDAAPWTAKVTEVIGLGVPRYACEPSLLATGVGRRIDEQLAGIVQADAAFLALEPAVSADHLLVTERMAGPNPFGSAFGRLFWGRHRRGGRRPREVVDLFPSAEAFELPVGEPLTNRGAVHDALLRWLV